MVIEKDKEQEEKNLTHLSIDKVRCYLDERNLQVIDVKDLKKLQRYTGIFL